MFPDFTKEVQKKRASFQGVKKRLRQNGLTYSMLFPARLRLETDGGVLFFTSSTEASLWIDNHYPEAPEERRSARNGAAGGRRRQAPSRSPPSSIEVLLERQRVVEVVASMSRGAGGPSRIEEELSRHGTESEHESELSMDSTERLPVVTPGTSDEIL